jgi:segregation and condensation protein B
MWRYGLHRAAKRRTCRPGGPVRSAFAALLPLWRALSRILASRSAPRAPSSHKVPTPMDHTRRPAAQHTTPPETAVASRMTPLAAQVEALLLVAGDTATVEALAHALKVSKDAVEEGLDALDQHYAETGHGARLQRLGARVHLATAPEHAGVVARFLGVPERTRLSPAALETLAIVAYRQPVTRPEIESIRGVNCDHVMRSLLDQGLIEERGRADTPGRPAVYGTTMTFLEALGLRTLDDLPPLDER